MKPTTNLNFAKCRVRRAALKRFLVVTFVLGLCSGILTTRESGSPRQEFGLRAESPQFWKLIPKGAQLAVVARGFGFTEGPVWDPAGFLYVSDEEQNKIYRVALNGQKTEVVSLGDPDGNTYDSEHRLIDCASVLRAIIRVSPNWRIQSIGGSVRRQEVQQSE